MARKKKDSIDYTRLPRSDIPADYICPYPQCEFTGKNELSFRGHMAQSHHVKYARKEPSDVKKKLAKYGKTKEQLESIEEISQLAGWHCAALARHVVDGIPLGPLAKANKHSAETLRAVAKSPAAKKYMEKIKENLHDPITTARNMLAWGAPRKLLDWEEMWQHTVESGNAELLHKMAKDIGLHQVIRDENKQEGPATIVINLPTGTDLSTPDVKTRFEIPVVEAEVEDDEQS